MKSPLIKIWNWLKNDCWGIAREMRWSYMPPLMVYLAAGVSSFTGIIEAFFVKDKLGLSAEYLAALGFWAGLPWALKMPLGHLVDLYWRWKAIFVYLGAFLMAVSLGIMVGLTGYLEALSTWLPPDTWYVLSVLISPIGFVLQDVVADAMTVEAVPPTNDDGTPVPEKELQRRHVTMQTLGRIAIVGGAALVAGIGGWLAQTLSYERMYEISLVIPITSVIGVVAGTIMQRRRHDRQRRLGLPPDPRTCPTEHGTEAAKPNGYILGGGGFFVVMTLALGLSPLPLKKEIIFLGSLIIIAFLMAQILRDITAEKRRDIVAIAVIIFVFRAMPSFGAGASWWQIDILRFDEAFFGTLRQISALLTIAGMFALRGWMARRPIPYLVVFLSLYGTVMLLPFIGMFYGLHLWTEQVFGFGARTIAIVDTLADSPLGQVAMIPMLAWIAREAPLRQKATYFAVMAAFTNLALSASNLGTEYMNRLFVITRGAYGELGSLMIAVGALNLAIPIVVVLFLHPPWRRERPLR